MEATRSGPVTQPGGAACVVCGEALDGARCGHCGVAPAPGGWRIVKQLAKGPHSRVFLAEKSGQQVALKELLFALVPDAAQLEGFEREARLLAQLKHPSIPRLVESFREGLGVHTRLYLAQQFVHGRSLLEQMQTHRFDEAEAKQLARELLTVLEYLHGLSPRVIHRDLKPANVMRRDDGSLALVDFGAARDLVRGVTHGATLVGTFGYMPPEQLGGTVDVTSDLYALGATLIHLLSRRSPEEFLKPGMELQFADDINVSDGLRGWLTTLVRRERSERFGSARQAREALDALEQRAARPKPSRQGGRNLTVLFAVVPLILAGAFAVVRMLAPSRPPERQGVSLAVPPPPAPERVLPPKPTVAPRAPTAVNGPTSPGVEVVTVPKAKPLAPFTLENAFSVSVNEQVSSPGGALELVGVAANPGTPGALTLTTRPGNAPMFVELIDQQGRSDPSRATVLTQSKAGDRVTRLPLPLNSRKVQLRFGPQASPLATYAVDLAAGTVTRAR